MSSVSEELNKFEVLLQHLPAGWQELAVEKCAFGRSRQIKSPLELLRLVFVYLAADNSLRSVAAALVSRRIWMTDQAVFNRLHNCRDWLETLLAQMLNQQLTTQMSARAQTILHRRLKIVDATVLNCPGAKGEDYRLHLCFDAVGQSVCAVKLSDKRIAESLTHFQYRAGEIVLGDRIYAKAWQIIEVVKQGADAIVRLSFQQLTLLTAAGNKFNWKQLLIDSETVGKLSATAFARDQAGNQVQVWLYGKRLGEREREKARRKIRLQAIKTGCQTREATIKLSEWIIVLTTIPETELNGEEVLELYRLRWQIEIYFKRLKGLCRLGRMRSCRGGALAEADIFGRLLLALLLTAESGKRLWARWDSLISRRTTTVYGIWKAMLEELREAVLETCNWREDKWSRKLKILRQRKRKRKLRTIAGNVLNKLKVLSQFEMSDKTNRIIGLPA